MLYFHVLCCDDINYIIMIYWSEYCFRGHFASPNELVTEHHRVLRYMFGDYPTDM